MTFVLVIFLITVAAVLATVGLTVGLRAAGSLGALRVARYQARVKDHVTAYAVGARDDPPPAPAGLLEQRLMRRDLVTLAPNLKGDAGDLLSELFVAYGLDEVARRDLEARDALTRIRAAEALGTLRVTAAVPWLVERLGHPDPLLRLACARSLATLGAVDTLPVIVAALSDAGADPGEVADVLLTFGARGVPFLREQVQAAPPDERRLAASTLGEIRALEAVPELHDALADADHELVARAARALGQIGAVSAAESLVAVLRDPSRPWFVRVAAANALGALDDPRAAGPLAATLADEEWDVRNAAALALRGLGRAGMDAVAAAVDDLPDAGVAHYAGVLDMEHELEDVIRAAATGDARLARLVHRAAAAGVRARLEDAASDPDDRVRAYASAVLAGPGAAGDPREAIA